jgi:glycosyltransferase involved in cell wall biosynthesis
VSSPLHETTLRIDGSLKDRAFHISYGVPHDPSLPRSSKRGLETLRMIYSGRFNEEQKRVSDLARIARGLAERGTPFHLSLVGNGPSEGKLKAALMPLVERRCVDFPAPMTNDALLPLYADYDCFVLVSNYEGLPVALLESMGSGCIPVVTDLARGIPDVVRHGENGFALPVGDVGAFIECLDALQRDRARRQALGISGLRKHHPGGAFTIETAVARYDEVLGSALRQHQAGALFSGQSRIDPTDGLATSRRPLRCKFRQMRITL